MFFFRREPGRLAIDSLILAKNCAKIAAEKLGEDIRILDMAEILRITDYFVIITGRNRRHVLTLAQEIDQRMKAQGVAKKRIEGLEEGRWALLDYADVVVHILEEEARRYYGLEHLWADAPNVEFDPDEALDAAG